MLTGTSLGALRVIYPDQAMAPTAPAPTAGPVSAALAGLQGPVLVVTDLPVERVVAEGLADDVTVLPLGAAPADPRFRTVLLAVADPAALRRAATALPPLGGARTVGCVVLAAPAPVLLRPRPLWPALVDLDARVDGAGVATTRVRFATRVGSAAEVLVELARATGLPAGTGNAGLFVALGGDTAAPPVDPSAVTSYDVASETPPDVVVGGGAGDLPETAVLGRAPVRLATSDDLAVGPLDEALLNPHGFRREWDGEVVDLPPDASATPGCVRALRGAQGVRVTWPADERAVAALAMSGVPLVSGPVPALSRARLGDALADVLEQQVDLADALPREEHSVRLRRAALAHHSTLGWRGRLAARAGTRSAAHPTVSIVLPTRRPDLLDFALRQVAKQRASLPGVEIELVLAAHGFVPDAAQVAAALDGRAHTVLPLDAATLFGDVLRAATDAAAGDVVLKMDDDDWYGGDVVTDLLLARRYSGAELVGMPAEMVYLEPIATTVRRRGPSEGHGAVVAGGTMMIDRSLLRAVGGFRPVRRFVDAQLLDAVRVAGGSTYRTHGLGYLLRRTSAGHTWDTGLGYFLTRQAVADQWHGFRPSALLDHDVWEAPR